MSSSTLNTLHHLEATPLQNLFHGIHRPSGLIEPNIKRIRGRTGTHHNSLFPLMQRLGQPTRATLHQSIYQPVKQQFQCSGHISPITRRTHYHNIAPLHQPQYPQRIIFGQYTCAFLPTSHTPHAGSYLQMRHRHSFTLDTRPNSFYTHSIGHFRKPRGRGPALIISIFTLSVLPGTKK